MKPLNKVQITWSPQFAYAIGLLAADGCVSKDGRHINFTSKDYQLIEIFKKSLNIENIVSKKARGGGQEKKYYYVQFSDVVFCKFLATIGIGPNKSRAIKKVDVPDNIFYHFLRGYFDGDGNINEYLHPESKHVQLKMRFISGSKRFLEWIDYNTTNRDNIKGYLTKWKGAYVLCYGKSNSIKLIGLLYCNVGDFCLLRKFEIVKQYLAGVA